MVYVLPKADESGCSEARVAAGRNQIQTTYWSAWLVVNDAGISAKGRRPGVSRVYFRNANPTIHNKITDPSSGLVVHAS